MSYRINSILIILLIAFAACSSENTPVDSGENNENGDPPSEISLTSVTLNNAGATAYVVTAIDGDDANASLNEQNSDIGLRIGARFEFINESGASNHPLDFRNSDRQKLFGQSNASGLFDGNEGIDLEKDGNTLRFTLTEELAAEIADYICSFHPGMNGDIFIID